jgi:uncharacterized membrane protein YedE/YeeE
LVLIFSLVAGVIFGIGLTVADMINPARILNFLDVAGSWDPTLLFVMAGAVSVTALGYKLAFARTKPLIGDKFNLPTRKQVDLALVGGSALFGVGWGLTGICPGPGFTNLVTLQPKVLLFIAAMLVGMTFAKSWRQLLGHNRKTA